MELPAERDQGLGAWIQECTDRPLEHARGRSGLLKGGLDFRYLSRHVLSGRGNDSAGGCRGGWRQALGGSPGLSFIR